MPGGQTPAVIVVCADRGDLFRDRSVNGDQRLRQRNMLFKVLRMAGQDHARHFVALQHIKILFLFAQFQIGNTKQQLVAIEAGIPLHMVDHHAEKKVARGRND